MSSDWPIVPIRSACVGIFDGPHATPQKTSTGPIFLSIESLDAGRLDLSRSAHVSEEDFVRWTRRVTPEPGDVVFSYETRIGQAALVPDDLRCCLGRRLALMRADQSRVLPRYLLYAYLGPEFQATLRERTVQGSTVERILLTDFPDFPVRLPSLAEQRRIIGVLGALDDKIEHNARLSRRLAKLALVRFESRRFEWINEGSVGDLGSPVREASTNGAPYIGLEHMPRGSTILTDWAEGAVVENSIAFRRGDVLFGKLRPYFKKVGVAPLDGRCSTEILVLRPNADHLWGPLLGYVSSDPFVDYCVQVSRGTKMPRSEWKDASTFRIRVPDETEAAELTTEMRGFYGAAVALVHESKTLRSLRDALLPKLVSGAIRVPDSYDSDDALGAVAEAAGVAIS
jgi:type I restriction enzyme S subunit